MPSKKYDDTIRKKAYDLYCTGLLFREISEKLGVNCSTIRNWCQREEWDKKSKNIKTIKRIAAKKRKEETQRKKIKKRAKENLDQKNKKAVKQLMENDELTDSEKMFCIYYVDCFNATKAYMKAFPGVSKVKAGSRGHMLLKKRKIQDEINILKANKFNRAMLEGDDIFQQFIDIAFADIGDFLEFKSEKKLQWKKKKNGEYEKVIDPSTGEQAFIEYNTVKIKDSFECDTRLISEISEGRDGLKIKLHNKVDALKWLADRTDLLTDVAKRKLEMEEEKLNMLKEEKEKDKLNDQPIKIQFVRASESVKAAGEVVSDFEEEEDE